MIIQKIGTLSFCQVISIVEANILELAGASVSEEVKTYTKRGWKSISRSWLPPWAFLHVRVHVPEMWAPWIWLFLFSCVIGANTCLCSIKFHYNSWREGKEKLTDSLCCNCKLRAAPKYSYLLMHTQRNWLTTFRKQCYSEEMTVVTKINCQEGVFGMRWI